MAIPLCPLTLRALAAAALFAAPAFGATPLPPQKAGNWDALKYTFTKPEVDDTFYGTPIGNAHLGAKIKGGVGREYLALNDKYFCLGGPGMTPENSSRKTALTLTRTRLASGDIAGAETAAKGMQGSNNMGTFLPLGSLALTFSHGDSATGYSRVLDLDRSLSTIKYTISGVTYTREAFASFPDDVIVMRLTASAAGKISFTAALAYPLEMEGNGASLAIEGGNVIVMKGRAPANTGWDTLKGMKAEARLKIIPTGGALSTATNQLVVANADSVLLIFANATSYNGFDKEPGTQGLNPTPIVQAALTRASAKTYDTLLAAHQADHRSLFRRLWVEIGTQATPDPRALGLQYARYEMISCSRTGNRPHAQQGIWSYKWSPTSHGAHWLNENVEKYYSLNEPANLSDCSEPLWNWMKELAVNGTKSATVDWGFKGWLAGQCSDIWAKTSLASGNNEWSIWPMGGVWLCQNLHDHYAFTRDKTFLRDRAYPILKGAVEFCLDYLVTNSAGDLVTSPSTSPENRFGLVENGPAYAVTVGSTMDTALIRELFQNTIEASKILEVDSALRARMEDTLLKLPTFKISANGASTGELQEWDADYSRLPADTGNKYTPHRHASHVVSVWPLRQITERGTPELFAAAKLALTNRGSGGYHPDKGAMWARLHDGDKTLSSNDTMPQTNLTGQYPPKYAAFAELLLQSHTGELELLPALPTATAWKSGKVSGLRARGNYELSLEWSNSALVKCQIDSLSGKIPTVRYQGLLLDPTRDSRITLYAPSLEVLAGESYNLTGTLTTGTLIIYAGGKLTGGGTINAALVNDGVIETTASATITFNGGIANSGTMCFTAGAGYTQTGGNFINNGILDLITAGSSTPPTGGAGVTLTAADLRVTAFDLAAGVTPTLNMPTRSGHGYQLQRRGDLTAGTWIPVGPVKPGNGSAQTFTDPAPASGGRAFYRVLISP